jgi:hypothetical protein
MSCNGTYWIGLEVRQAQAELRALCGASDSQQRFLADYHRYTRGAQGAWLSAAPDVARCNWAASCDTEKKNCGGAGSFKCYEAGAYNHCTNGACFTLGLPGCGACCSAPGVDYPACPTQHES